MNESTISGSIIQVDIDLIETNDIPNHREPKLVTESSIKELAASIEQQGLLQPVLLYEHPGKEDAYILCYGHRRLAAVQSLGWKIITAEVRPWISRETLLFNRAVENFQRQELNVMEQVVAIEHAFRAAGHDLEATAAGLSRPVKWTRDMLYLGERLGDGTREIALQGLLGLGHLRELAKLGDHKMQAKIAEWGGGKLIKGGEIRLRPIEWFRKEVEQRRRSLKVVPWRLDIAFVGKLACSSCPHNSATDPQLFEMDDPKAKQGYCLNQPCFDAKTKASEKAIEKVITRVKRQDGTATPTAIQLAADDAKATMLKETSLVRSVKKAVGGDATKKDAKPARDPFAPKPLTPLQKAIVKYQDARKQWFNRAAKAITHAADADGMTYAILLLLLGTKAWNNLPCSDTGDVARHHGEPRGPLSDKRLSPKARKTIDLLSSSDLDDQVEAIGTLAQMPRSPRWNMLSAYDTSNTALQAVASAIGADVPQPPSWEDYDPAQAKPARKKVKKKKVAKKSTKKKAVAKPANKAGDDLPAMPTPSEDAGSTPLEGLISDGVVRAFIKAAGFRSDNVCVYDLCLTVKDIGWPKLREQLEEHGAMPGQIDQARNTILRHIAENAQPKGE